MERFYFPYHTYEVEYPESSIRVKFGNNWTFTAKPDAPDLRKIKLTFPAMRYFEAHHVVRFENSRRDLYLNRPIYTQDGVNYTANLETNTGRFISSYSAGGNGSGYYDYVRLADPAPTTVPAAPKFVSGTNNPPFTVDRTSQQDINLAKLEDFYNRHRLHEKFVYPHPVYGDMVVKFQTPLKIPQGSRGGDGLVQGINIELMEQVT